MALIRIRDARVLLKTGWNASGAYYVAGYAVECGLKACLAKQTKSGDWPPKPEKVRGYYSHNLEDLVKLAGLQSAFETAMKTDPILTGYWGIVKDWSEQSRYETYTQSDALALFDAITNNPHGVFAWIQQHW